MFITTPNTSVAWNITIKPIYRQRKKLDRNQTKIRTTSISTTEYEASWEDNNDDYVNKFAPEIAWVLTFRRDTIGVFVRKIYQLLGSGDLNNIKNISLKSWKIMWKALYGRYQSILCCWVTWYQWWKVSIYSFQSNYLFLSIQTY